LCGWNYYGQLGNGTTTSEFVLRPLKIVGLNGRIINASCGASFTFLITEHFDVYAFGKK